MRPLVSVVTAVFNDEKFIRSSVESILKQSFREFEYFVVDDGSTDRTVDILNELAATDERLIVISQKNAGAAAARNLAFRRAAGTYIAIQDSDDISSPDRLEVQVNQLSQSNGMMISCSGFHVIDGKDQIITSNNKIYENINANILKGSFSACHPTMMFPARLVVEAEGYNPFYKKAEDYDLILRLLEKGAIIEKINECLYSYRIREDSEGSMNNGAYSSRVYENHLNRINGAEENFSEVSNEYKKDKNYLVKRQAHELFFSENYEAYRKFYFKELFKLSSISFFFYFIYSLMPAGLRRWIKSVFSNGIKLVKS